MRSRRLRRSSTRSPPRRALRSPRKGSTRFAARSSGAARSGSRAPTRRCRRCSGEQPSAAELTAAFAAAHERHFGFRAERDAALVVESIEVEAVAARGATPHLATGSARASREHPSRDTPEDHPWGSAAHIPVRRRSREGRSRLARAEPVGMRSVYLDGEWRATPLFEARGARPGYHDRGARDRYRGEFDDGARARLACARRRAAA